VRLLRFLDGRQAGPYGPNIPLFRIGGFNGPIVNNGWHPKSKERHPGWTLFSYHPRWSLTWRWLLALSTPSIWSHEDPRLTRGWGWGVWWKEYGNMSLVMYGWSLHFQWQPYMLKDTNPETNPFPTTPTNEKSPM